jgi:hypothetical protein
MEIISDERIENGFIFASRHLVRKSNTEEVRVFLGTYPQFLHSSI